MPTDYCTKPRWFNEIPTVPAYYSLIWTQSTQDAGHMKGVDLSLCLEPATKASGICPESEVGPHCVSCMLAVFNKGTKSHWDITYY